MSGHYFYDPKLFGNSWAARGKRSYTLGVLLLVGSATSGFAKGRSPGAALS